MVYLQAVSEVLEESLVGSLWKRVVSRFLIPSPYCVLDYEVRRSSIGHDWDILTRTLGFPRDFCSRIAAAVATPVEVRDGDHLWFLARMLFFLADIFEATHQRQIDAAWLEGFREAAGDAAEPDVWEALKK